MEFTHKLKNNIKKDYVFTLISRFDLTSGIWMLYLAYKGLTLFEIGLMETVYHLSSFSLEIPTGAIADIFGRKTSRVLGRVSTIVSMLIMIYGSSVAAFGISFVFGALGNNLESGAGEALVYDSLKEVGDEETYMKIRGRNELCYQITKTLSLLLGGYLATQSYSNVYMVACFVAVLSLLQALTFTEPNIGKVDKSNSLFNTFVLQLKKSIEVVKNDKELVKLVVSLEVFSTLYTTIFFYLQNHLKSLGHNEFEIALVLAIGAGVAAGAALKAHEIEARFKLRGILIASTIIAGLSFWGITIEGYEKYAFIMLCGIEGILFVTISDYINKLIPSQQRATILSFQSMTFSFFMIMLFPVVGKIGDVYGLPVAFKIVAGIGTIALCYLIYMTQRSEKHS